MSGMSPARMFLPPTALGKNPGTGSKNSWPAGMVDQCAYSANKPNHTRRICYQMMQQRQTLSLNDMKRVRRQLCDSSLLIMFQDVFDVRSVDKIGRLKGTGLSIQNLLFQCLA